MLILLDCCASGLCTTDEGNGVTELIAACAYNSTANGVGLFSFTHALNEKLQRLSQLPSFNIGYLYNSLFTEIQSWRISDSRHKKAPVHLVLSQNPHHPRSIRISSNIRKSGASQGSNFGTASTSPDTPATPSTVLISQLPEYPRLLFSIRIDENVKPIDLSIEFFADWLRELPMSSSLVRVEAGFASDSTLLLLSLPVAMLGYLPSNSAITLLGTTRSRNLLLESKKEYPFEQNVSATGKSATSEVERITKPFHTPPVLEDSLSYEETLVPSEISSSSATKFGVEWMNETWYSFLHSYFANRASRTPLKKSEDFDHINAYDKLTYEKRKFIMTIYMLAETNQTCNS